MVGRSASLGQGLDVAHALLEPVGLEGFSFTAVVVTRRLGNMVLTEQAGWTLVTAGRKPYDPLREAAISQSTRPGSRRSGPRREGVHTCARQAHATRLLARPPRSTKVSN